MEQYGYMEQKKIDCNKLPRQGPRKTEGLDAVHEKYINLQKENVELKKMNLQFVAQAKLGGKRRSKMN